MTDLRVCPVRPGNVRKEGNHKSMYNDRLLTYGTLHLHNLSVVMLMKLKCMHNSRVLVGVHDIVSIICMAFASSRSGSPALRGFVALQDQHSRHYVGTYVVLQPVL